MTKTPKFAVGEKVLWTRDTFAMTRDERAGTIVDVYWNGVQFVYQIDWASKLLPNFLAEISSGSLMAKF